jgi:hypothetical protein
VVPKGVTCRIPHLATCMCWNQTHVPTTCYLFNLVRVGPSGSTKLRLIHIKHMMAGVFVASRHGGRCSLEVHACGTSRNPRKAFNVACPPDFPPTPIRSCMWRVHTLATSPIPNDRQCRHTAHLCVCAVVVCLTYG